MNSGIISISFPDATMLLLYDEARTGHIPWVDCKKDMQDYMTHADFTHPSYKFTKTVSKRTAENIVILIQEFVRGALVSDACRIVPGIQWTSRTAGDNH